MNATAIKAAAGRHSQFNLRVFRDGQTWSILPYDEEKSWVLDSRDDAESEDARLYPAIRLADSNGKEVCLTLRRAISVVEDADGVELPWQGSFNLRCAEIHESTKTDEETLQTIASEFAGKSITCSRKREYQAYVWKTGLTKKTFLVEFNA